MVLDKVLPFNIPKVEGFMPLPNSAVIPFMELQSAVMARAFGMNFQFGKRLISSLNNTEFNALVDSDAVEAQEVFYNNIKRLNQRDYKQFYDDIKSPDTQYVQEFVLKHSIKLEQDKLTENIELFKWMFAKLIGDETVLKWIKFAYGVDLTGIATDDIPDAPPTSYTPPPSEPAPEPAPRS